ncbi:hypothetical protein NDU88_005702 [Pleurodeles waltl]|uniref:Uncharacterized protein n=1 Tax=Pleurodeles waltl TaxID=8319 RepID=A0AAV7PJA2_PLEWA|nr:hypothetical protein NDU88_005702 [Pleurodeles waltl]
MTYRLARWACGATGSQGAPSTPEVYGRGQENCVGHSRNTREWVSAPHGETTKLRLRRVPCPGCRSGA